MFRHRKKSVQLNVIKAIELKPECNYVLVADSRHVTRADMQEIMKQCRKIGVKNVVSFLLNGGEQSSVQLIDRPKARRDKNGKFTKRG